jgi:hypothetical protein
MKKEKPNSDKPNKMEPLDDEMMAAVYLTVVNKQNPIDFTEVLKAHRKEEERKQFFKHVEELVKPQRKKSYKEESAPKRRDIVVSDDLKREDVDGFLRVLEETTMKPWRSNREVRILDRSSLPWKFPSMALASYVASVLINNFPVPQAFVDMEIVVGYKGRNFHALITRSAPTGAKEVDEALKMYKQMKNSVVK